MTEIEGETVIKADPEIGYLHTGIEKIGRKSLLDAGLDRHRADGLSLAAHQCDVLRPRRREAARNHRSTSRSARNSCAFCCASCSRIASHCVWLGTRRHRPRRDLGVFLRASICARTSSISPKRSGGARMHPNYLRIGGLQRRPARGLPRQARRADREVSPAHARAARRSAKEPDLARPHDRRRHPAPKKRSHGASPGPPLRAIGIAYDVRKAFPYCGYEQYEFDVPTRTEGDAYARFLVRLDEMDESMRIIEQVARAAGHAGPGHDRRHQVRAAAQRDDRAFDGSADPSLQIVSEGFRVPPGDVYQSVEGPRGELGYYIVTNGENRPWRVRTRPPSLQSASAQEASRSANLIADMVVMIGSLDPVFGEVDR